MSLSDQSLSLLELNEQLKDCIQSRFFSAVWIRAEISELHENSSGHAYLELIEKEANADFILAKSRANCWASTYRMLKPYFESTTGENLKPGIKVLIACTVEYHELYGLSLTIKDIEPAYTVGDMAQKRLKTIRRLQEDGVFDMNKQLSLSKTPQRIAIISSETAAGYGDFMHQLLFNEHAFIFYIKLFPAIMQGEQSVASIISVLDAIYKVHNCFDAVLIIRGGGASAELSSFDSYDLAFNCTQFPLPIITGIGHLRDESVLDLVAHTSAKTPTAVADFLLDCMDEAEREIDYLQRNIVQLTQQLIAYESARLQKASTKLPNLVKSHTASKKEALSLFELSLHTSLRQFFASRNHQLSLMENETRLSSPERLLKKGYSLTFKNGKLVKSSAQLKKGDAISSRFFDGTTDSVVS